MYQTEKYVVLLIILIKIWSNYIRKHVTDNIEGLCHARLGLFNISAMVRPKHTWSPYSRPTNPSSLASWKSILSVVSRG